MDEKTRTDFVTASKIPIMVNKETIERYDQLLKASEDGKICENLEYDVDHEFDDYATVDQVNSTAQQRKRSFIDVRKSKIGMESNSPARKR
jgi:hypothetical protein